MVVVDVDACACSCDDCCSKTTEGAVQQTALTLCKCPTRKAATCCESTGEATVEEVAPAEAAGEGGAEAAAAAATTAEVQENNEEELADCCKPGAPQKTPALDAPRREWLKTVMMSMATSGCCLLQLGLNLLPAFSSSGCFGMNTHLKKLRPLFATASVLWFGRWAWKDFGPGAAPATTDDEKKARKAAAWRFAITAAVSLLISVSPEIIGLISRRRGAAAMANASQEITINVLEMGCEACSEAVGRALRALPGAAGGMANFREGTASLFVKSGNISPEQIKTALEGVGYGFGGIVSSVALKK